MTTHRIVPGGGFADETTSLHTVSPSGGFINQTAGAAVSLASQVPSPITGTVGSFTPYDFSLHFAGSATPFTYTKATGTWPAGLTLNAGTGVLSATGAMSAGDQTGISVTATDANTATATTNTFTVSISAAPGSNSGLILIMME